jgi:hypothetical protein
MSCVAGKHEIQSGGKSNPSSVPVYCECVYDYILSLQRILDIYIELEEWSTKQPCLKESTGGCGENKCCFCKTREAG